MFADEQERDLENIAAFFALAWIWWCMWRWRWFRWHMLRHSLSELVLCYLANIAFFIGGNDEHEWPFPDWLIAGQWLSDVVPVIEVASGVWLWVVRRTDKVFFWREISLRSSDSFFSMSFLRCNDVKHNNRSFKHDFTSTHLHFVIEFFLYNVNFLSQIYNTFDEALWGVLQISLTRNILLLSKKQFQEVEKMNDLGWMIE